METFLGNTNLINWRIGLIDSLRQKNEVLLPEEKAIICEFKSENRWSEFIAIRNLKEIDFPGQHIQYLTTGKPVFSDQNIEIGISHSAHWALFAYSELPFGCDVEELRPRLSTVESKFCTNAEVELFAITDRLTVLTTLWSCKESIYKLIQVPGIHFKTQIICQKVNQEQLLFLVNINNKSVNIACTAIQHESAIITFATYA